jgi:hypothetical protein
VKARFVIAGEPAISFSLESFLEANEEDEGLEEMETALRALDVGETVRRIS